MFRYTFIAICAAAALSGAALAQSTKPANPATPANPIPNQSQSQSSGTGPGEAGSTGWTGGIGGSNIGTTQDGPTAASPNAHPETAKGLDPIKPKGETAPK